MKINPTPCPSPLRASKHAGAKPKKIVGGVHNPNLPTDRLRSNPICRQTDFVRTQFADRQTSFEPNLPTDRLRSNPICRQTDFVRTQFADRQTSFEPNLPTDRLQSNLICRQTDFVRAKFADKQDFPEFYQQHKLTSTIDIRQLCRQAKYCRDAEPPLPPIATPLPTCH